MKSSSDVTLIRAAFAMQPILLGAWFPRLPQIQAALELNTSELAVALMGLPVGLLAFLFVGGRLAEHLGTRRSMIGGHAAFLLFMPLPAFAVTGTSLFLALALAGLALAAAELALNVTADKIEKVEGRPIMTGCHGFWSLGVLVGSVLGSAFAAMGVSPGDSLAGLAVFAALPVLLVSGRLNNYSLASTLADDTPSGPRLSVPLAGICFFSFGIALSEGAMADWASIYLTDVFDASPGLAGFGYTVFALMVATGRFFGDTVRRHLTMKTVARVFCLGALIGATVLVTAPNAPVAFAAIALFGLGVSIGFPLSVTAASAAPGRSATTNVALLSQISLCGFLVGPPVIGFLAEEFGMRIGFTALIPAILMSAAFSRHLGSTK